MANWHTKSTRDTNYDFGDNEILLRGLDTTNMLQQARLNKAEFDAASNPELYGGRAFRGNEADLERVVKEVDSLREASVNAAANGSTAEFMTARSAYLDRVRRETQAGGYYNFNKKAIGEEDTLLATQQDLRSRGDYDEAVGAGERELFYARNKVGYGDHEGRSVFRASPMAGVNISKSMQSYVEGWKNTGYKELIKRYTNADGSVDYQRLRDEYTKTPEMLEAAVNGFFADLDVRNAEEGIRRAYQGDEDTVAAWRSIQSKQLLKRLEDLVIKDQILNMSPPQARATGRGVSRPGSPQTDEEVRMQPIQVDLKDANENPTAVGLIRIGLDARHATGLLDPKRAPALAQMVDERKENMIRDEEATMLQGSLDRNILGVTSYDIAYDIYDNQDGHEPVIDLRVTPAVMSEKEFVKMVEGGDPNYQAAYEMAKAEDQYLTPQKFYKRQTATLDAYLEEVIDGVGDEDGGLESRLRFPMMFSHQIANAWTDVQDAIEVTEENISAAAKNVSFADVLLHRIRRKFPDKLEYKYSDALLGKGGTRWTEGGTRDPNAVDRNSWLYAEGFELVDKSDEAIDEMVRELVTDEDILRVGRYDSVEDLEHEIRKSLDNASWQWSTDGGGGQKGPGALRLLNRDANDPLIRDIARENYIDERMGDPTTAKKVGMVMADLQTQSTIMNGYEMESAFLVADSKENKYLLAAISGEITANNGWLEADTGEVLDNDELEGVRQLERGQVLNEKGEPMLDDNDRPVKSDDPVPYRVAVVRSGGEDGTGQTYLMLQFDAAFKPDESDATPGRIGAAVSRTILKPIEDIRGQTRDLLGKAGLLDPFDFTFHERRLEVQKEGTLQTYKVASTSDGSKNHFVIRKSKGNKAAVTVYGKPVVVPAGNAIALAKTMASYHREEGPVISEIKALYLTPGREVKMSNGRMVAATPAEAREAFEAHLKGYTQKMADQLAGFGVYQPERVAQRFVQAQINGVRPDNGAAYTAATQRGLNQDVIVKENSVSVHASEPGEGTFEQEPTVDRKQFLTNQYRSKYQLRGDGYATIEEPGAPDKAPLLSVDELPFVDVLQERAFGDRSSGRTTGIPFLDPSFDNAPAESRISEALRITPTPNTPNVSEVAPPDSLAAVTVEATEIARDTGDMSPFNVAAEMIGMDEAAQNEALRDFLATGGANINPEQTAWCAAFMNAVLNEANLEGTGKLTARSFLTWGQEVTEPKRGDIVVLERGGPGSWQGHVGFFDSYNEDGSVRVLGGNQRDGTSDSTGAVVYADYDANRVLGFRRVGD